METTAIQAGHFATVELNQGTVEWLEWRKHGIGCSDAPVIMGESPWKTAGALLREKRGCAAPCRPNAAMIRGTALEPEARRAYIAQTGKWMEPACLQSTAYEWLRASVDGIGAGRDGVVEIKCGESVYEQTAALGCAPGYYYGQLQHILAVTGLPSIDFWCYLPSRAGLLVAVERDDTYIARLLEAEYRSPSVLGIGQQSTLPDRETAMPPETPGSIARMVFILLAFLQWLESPAALPSGPTSATRSAPPA